MKKELTILIVGTVLWCGGIILAPLLSPSIVSDMLYTLYSTICHQFHSRSFQIHGASFAVCIRCTAIYFGFFIALPVLRFSIVFREKQFPPAMILTLCAVPIALDGFLSFTHFYEPSVISRVITGGIFGIGLALLLHSSLSELIHGFVKRIKIGYEEKT
jgi:uncharacterized membrane protein